MQRIVSILSLILLPVVMMAQPLQVDRKDLTAMTLQDFYKVNYQSYFGAEHMAPDTASVLRYLERELATEDDLTLLPELQYIGGYYRVSLRVVKEGRLNADSLAYAFIETARPVHHEEGEWAARWAEIEREVTARYPELRDEALQAELRKAAAQNAAVHHSDSYRSAYHPHYRIVRADLVEQMRQRGVLQLDEAEAKQDSINRVIYQRIADQLQPRAAAMPMGELVVEVALRLLGTEYQWATLESDTERLRVSLDKTDCILFVELCTSMAATLKGRRIVQAGDGEHFLHPSGRVLEGGADAFRPLSAEAATPSYALLVHNIRQMRYRLGEVSDYSSRIHYTSEWLLQAETNGVLTEYTGELGKVMQQRFSYMSDHPDTYYQLRRDAACLERIRRIEQHLNEQAPYYILTQEQLRRPEVMAQIKSGDIITFISPREGLDLAHVAIAYEVDGAMHFIHASYGAKQVIVEPKTLAEYATRGIRVSRLQP